MAELIAPDRPDDDAPPAQRPDESRAEAAKLGTRSSSNAFSGAILNFADAAVDIVEPLFSARKGSNERWVILEGDEGLAVHQVRRGRGQLVAAPSAGGDVQSRWAVRASRASDVELRIDPDRIIARRLSLPADGRNFLEAIIEHRLDRLTPWKAEKVLYGFRIAQDQKAEGLLDVDFAATSRDGVADSLARLGRLGVVPTAIGSAGDPIEQPVPIDLLRGSGDRKRLRRRRTLLTALLTALPLLIALFIASLFVLSAEEQRLDTAAGALSARRDAIRAGVGGDEAQQAALAIIDGKQAGEARFLLIDRLAAAIPPGSFLSDLEIRPGSLRLRGSSDNAPALIPILEAVSFLQGVRFEAPVAREADGRDRFDIVATLANEEEPDI